MNESIHYWTRAVAVVCLLLSGCGREELPYSDNSQDPNSYARDVKVLVITTATQARKSREPADQLSGIVQELGQKDRPRGEFAKVYEQIRTDAEQLMLECQKVEGRIPDLSKRLDSLVKLVDALPGETKSAAELAQ